MPGGKAQQGGKAYAAGKSKEKTTLNFQELRKLIQQAAPKNDDKFFFELYYLIIAITSLACQNLHIYRLNFYNYDFKLLIYSLLIFSRRLLERVIQQRDVVDPLEKRISTLILKRLPYLILFNIVYLTYQMIVEYTWGSIFVLFYYPLMVLLAYFFMNKDQRYDNVINEVSYLWKSTLFRGLEMLYFTLFLPLKSHDENLYYDLPTAMYIGLIALINSNMYNIFFQICYRSEEMRKQSKTLGNWKAIALSEKEKQNVEEWSLQKSPYKRNSYVQYEGKYYVATSKYNSAVPGNMQFKLIYYIFHDHKKTRIFLMLFMCVSIILQNVYIIYAYRSIIYLLLLVQSFFVVFLIVRLDKRLQNQIR